MRWQWTLMACERKRRLRRSLHRIMRGVLLVLVPSMGVGLWMSGTTRPFYLMCMGNPIGEAGSTAAMLAGVTEQLRIATGDPQRCPSIPELVQHDLLRREPLDPWDSPYLLRCDQGPTVEVRSAGPDRSYLTADDIVFPG